MSAYLRLTVLALVLKGGDAMAATSLWWDSDYAGRFNVAVSTGPNAPDKGYDGYTVRIAALDTASLVTVGQLRADCGDLRVAWFDGQGWRELATHIIGCNTARTDLRFALAGDLAAGAIDDNYYLYFGNPAPASAAPAMNESNVYLWFDDAQVDRSGSYLRDRIDNWHGSGHDDNLAWNPAGYYTYSTGTNATAGYMQRLDERDVYIEAEFMHTGCFSPNMTSGMLVRGISQNSGANTRSSNHYFASTRAEQAGCSGNGYRTDGDIVVRNGQSVAVDGPNPGDVITINWRRQALAAWGFEPVNLVFWDAENLATWAVPGFAAAADVNVAGTSADNVGDRGFAGVMVSQDAGRLRNILARRFVQPEPELTLSRESLPADVVLQKSLTTVYDPVNDTTNPKAIPGSWIEYTITAVNNGPGRVDPGTLVITDELPADLALFVGDFAGNGPIGFLDGTPPSNMAVTWGGPADMTDDVDFSVDGSNWDYVPNPDSDGFDSAVRHVRVRPSGSFAAAASGASRFEIRLRARVR